MFYILDSGVDIGNIFGPFIDKFFETFNIKDSFIPYFVIGIILLALLLGIMVIRKILIKPVERKYDVSSNLSDNLTDIKEYVYKQYEDILRYISEFDVDNLEKHVSPNVISSYLANMQSLAEKNYQRIITDFEVVYCNINDMHKTDEKEIIDVLLTYEIRDYIVDADGKIISGSKDKIRHVNAITFERASICKNCESILSYDATRCIYCRNELDGEKYSVLAKEKLIK